MAKLKAKKTRGKPRKRDFPWLWVTVVLFIAAFVQNFKDMAKMKVNAMGYYWKSIKRIVSITFVRHMDDVRNTIKEAFYRLTKRLSFATPWLDKFLAPRSNYSDFCK